MGGINGLCGHELIHKRNPIHKFVGTVTYSKILYSHFALEHGGGHHRNIATPVDPATAKKGENFYTFALRSAYGGFVGSWRRERNRLVRKVEGHNAPEDTDNETAEAPIALNFWF